MIFNTDEGSVTDKKLEKIDPAYPSGGGALGVGRDAALGTMAGAANLVLPMSGPLVQAIIAKCVQAPLDVRRAAWFNSVGEGLHELQGRLEGFDPGRLNENEEFVSAVAQATRAAVATHYAEKLEALRNVVLNAAAGMTLDEVTRGTFMALLERFSTLHLRFVKILVDPSSAPEFKKLNHSMHLMTIPFALGQAFEAAAQSGAIEVVLTDLKSAHLLGNLEKGVVSSDQLTSRYLTTLGSAFARFISSPLTEDMSNRNPSARP